MDVWGVDVGLGVWLHQFRLARSRFIKLMILPLLTCKNDFCYMPAAASMKAFKDSCKINIVIRISICLI